jgi:hypothetical protein
MGPIAIRRVTGRFGAAHGGADGLAHCRKDSPPRHTYIHTDRATCSAAKRCSDRSIIERRRKIQEVWNTSELFVPQKQVQERGINKESDRRINALLTGDQQKAYAALEQERKVQRRLRRAEGQSVTN